MISETIKTCQGLPGHISLADDLRCAAMEVQEDFPETRAKEFVAAAAECGYNPSTAARCWSFVKAQG